MVRTAWLIPLSIALLIAGLAIAQQAPSEDHGEDQTQDVVLAHPNQGDAGTHVYHDAEGQATQRTHLAWDVMETLLPDGDTHEAPTLSRTYTYEPDVQASDHDTNQLPTLHHADAWEDQHLQAANSQASTSIPADREHHTHMWSIPGEPIARTLQSTKTPDDGHEDAKLAYTSTQILDDACFAPLSLQLAGQNAANALAILETCIEQLYLERLDNDPEDVTIQTEDRWATHQEHGPVWIANVNTTLQDEANDTTIQHDRTVKTSPQASLVLEVTTHTTGHDGDEEIDQERTTLLEDYQEGQDALQDAKPLGELLTVDTVPWTMQGPTQDDLATFPLAQAQQAIQRTPDGLQFFQEAEDPRILHASFVDQDENVHAPIPGYSVNGADCKPTDSESLPHEAGQRSWGVIWTTEDDGRLLGFANEHRATQDALDTQTPTQRATAHTSDAGEEWPPFGHVPPLEGPSLSQLWEHRHVIEPIQAEGAWEVSIDAPYQEDGPLQGEVGKVRCIDHGDTFEFQEASIVFQDGTARAIWGMTFIEGY